MQNQPEPNPNKPQDVIDLGYLAASALAACFMPFLRAKPGTNAYSWPGLFALVLMFFWSGLGNLPELLLYLPVWIVMLIFRRITADRNAYSRYMGHPWIIMRLLPFLSERAAAVLEGLVVFGVGIRIYSQYPPLGLFVTAGGAGLLVKEAIERETHRARIRQMRDAQIDQQLMSESFRRR